MGDRLKPIIGAWATGCVIGYVTVTNFFNPAMPAPAFEPVVANLMLATALYQAIAVLFFDWAVQKSGQAMQTAWVIAISQILLVDVYYWMIGRRELEPALYSVVIIFVMWSAVAFVYDKLSDTA